MFIRKRKGYKTFSESQLKAYENYYIARTKHEQEQKERAQALVRELTEKLKEKNKEIQQLNIYIRSLKLKSTNLNK
jgi:selenocysteine lyase/cysteine desulfurase